MAGHGLQSAALTLARLHARSPRHHPTLHLLREDSVERAVTAYPDPDVIVERNLATLERLGADGWRALLQDTPPPAA
ncbi:DUF1415 family protein [Xanthomonas arboricola]|uniref:DUF1415 family protein n=1 Tax=Xanthomonas arboricola TaxID=56448 RepID=UPI003D18C315